MNIVDTPEQARFRAEVRAWIATHVPPHLKGLRQGIIRGPGLGWEALRPLREALVAQGWLFPGFPAEYGGGGLDPIQQIVFQEEYIRAGIPPAAGASGSATNISQILLKWGTPEQKARLLAPTLRAELRWCQGYSEPGSGSDLASLQTRAERVEGGYRISGQKIWTSLAQHADWIFLLARTDPQARRKQDGISFFVFDVRSPGVTITPIYTIDGFHHFNQTFYDNVFVPESGLVGGLNQGWTVAKALLVHERLNVTSANPLILRRALDDAKTIARGQAQAGGVVWDDPALCRRTAALEMDIDCMRYTRYRSLTRIARGEVPGNETMVFKFFGAELFQRILELHQQAAGTAGLAWDTGLFGQDIREVAVHNANSRGRSIEGGTSEVQRNVIAKRVLGLPD
ncbi:MAG: acyl-CoA dehydrogenase family protein [Candidatus Lambdaproteobacteria bacterium]|nr:acyl-CoA dehydrogenase family protein [Candidatus Lambdaproteobacteria bacterium]